MNNEQIITNLKTKHQPPSNYDFTDNIYICGLTKRLHSYKQLLNHLIINSHLIRKDYPTIQTRQRAIERTKGVIEDIQTEINTTKERLIASAKKKEALENEQNQANEPYTYPCIPGLKLRNKERAQCDGYLLYTGKREVCLAAADTVSNVLTVRANGNNGNWLLMIRIPQSDLASTPREYARAKIMEHIRNLAHSVGLDNAALDRWLKDRLNIDAVFDLSAQQVPRVINTLRGLSQKHGQ